MSGNDGSVIGAGEEEASGEEEEYEERMEDEEERREIKPNPTFPTKKRKLLSPRWASEAVDEISGGVIEDSNNNKIMNPIDLAIIKDHSYAKTKKPRVEKTADHMQQSLQNFSRRMILRNYQKTIQMKMKSRPKWRPGTKTLCVLGRLFQH